MTDAITAASSIDKARAVFEAEGLPMPPLSADETARLRSDGEFLFATRAIETPPYTLDIYLDEALAGAAPVPYTLFGFDGGGLASSALHYFLVEDGLAVFIQIGWGGAYTDVDDARGMIERAFAWVGGLRGRIREARAAGAMPKDWRLVAVVTEFDLSRWGFVRGNVDNRDAVDFSTEVPVSKAVNAALDDLLAGRRTLA